VNRGPSYYRSFDDLSVWSRRLRIPQTASQLRISSDPKLREALHEDETRIATHLQSILDSQTAKEAVLVLEGDSAQHFLDVIQHVA
jgi:hypothetical protein